MIKETLKTESLTLINNALILVVVVLVVVVHWFAPTGPG